MQAAEKASVCQEEERIKMRELTAEESEGNQDEAVMLHKLEDMIGKGNEAGCAPVFCGCIGVDILRIALCFACALPVRVSLWFEGPLLCLNPAPPNPIQKMYVCMLADEIQWASSTVRR